MYWCQHLAEIQQNDFVARELILLFSLSFFLSSATHVFLMRQVHKPLQVYVPGGIPSVQKLNSILKLNLLWRFWARIVDFWLLLSSALEKKMRQFQKTRATEIPCLFALAMDWCGKCKYWQANFNWCKRLLFLHQSRYCFLCPIYNNLEGSFCLAYLSCVIYKFRCWSATMLAEPVKGWKHRSAMYQPLFTRERWAIYIGFLMSQVQW